MYAPPRPRTVLMFAGQGAQYFQMARQLYEQDRPFRAAMDRCDAIAGLIEGQRISDLIYRRPMAESEQFDRQLHSTPALLAVGYALAQALFARGLRADLLLGYSFGETIAAVIAGMLTLADAFALVLAQSRLIEATLPPGAMVAVLGSWEALRTLPAIVRTCELAAVNSPRHFVVSLRRDDLPGLLAALDGADVVAATLPVRYGFHGSFIEPAGAGLRALLAPVPRQPPRIATISAMTTGELRGLDDGHLWEVARRPIRFAETVAALAAAGPVRFVEAGPTGTLATFVKQVLGPSAIAFPAINQFGQNLKTLAEIEAQFR